jgi:hypothetical protein
MMAKQNAKKSVVLFKYNGSPTAANALTLVNTPFLSPDVKSQDYSETGSGNLGQAKSYVDEHNTTVSFDLEAFLKTNNKAGDDLDTPPAISNLFKACGLTETPTTDTDVIYTPNHDYVEGSQALVYLDGYKREVIGAVANLKISGTVGEVAKAIFTVSGFTTPEAQAQPNPTVTLDTEALLIVSKVSAITYGGTALNIESFDFDLGNVINQNYTTGLSEFVRTDFDPMITLNGIKTKGDESGWTELVADSVKEIKIVLGSGPGKQFTLIASQAKTKEMSESDKEGIVNFSRTFRCQGDASGNNHFSMKYH